MLNGKKILVSSCAGVGDLLMFTPTLRKIKELYPQCTLTFLCNDKYKAAISGLPYLDKVITIKRGKTLGKMEAFKHAISQDYILFTDWQPQILAVSALFGVKNKTGIPKENHFFNKLLTKSLSHNVMKSTNYAAKTNALIFSEALGININIEPTIDISQPSDSDKEKVDYLLNGLNDYICIAPFAGAPEREWPYYQDFIKMVDKPVVVIGPPDKSELTIGKTSVLEMVEIIKRAKLFIGPDSGPMHIAGAVGTPCIALFSRDLPSRWAPKASSVVTLNLPCAPCDNETARNCKSWECMRGITPHQVLAATVKNLREIDYKG